MPLLVDIMELLVLLRVLGPFQCLDVGLKFVAQFMQPFGQCRMAHGVTALGQRLGQSACALARPAQWRLRITARRGLCQPLQFLCNFWILFNDTLSPRSDAAHTLGNIRVA